MKLKLVIIALTTMLLASCSSARRGAPPTVDTPLVSAVPSAASPSGTIASITSAYGHWNDLKVPVTLSLKSPASFSINGNLTMVNGREINLSLRFLGMEVVNIQVTADSVFGYYKPGKVYMAESTASLLGGFPLTVGNVQDLLLGRLFMVGNDPTTATGVRVVAFDGGSSRIVMPAVDRIDYSFDMDKGGTVRALNVTPEGERTVTCNYGADMSMASGPVAKSASVKTVVGRQQLDATVEYNLSKARWDEGNTGRWNRPKGYRRVKANELLSVFKF